MAHHEVGRPRCVEEPFELLGVGRERGEGRETGEAVVGGQAGAMRRGRETLRQHGDADRLQRR